MNDNLNFFQSSGGDPASLAYFLLGVAAVILLTCIAVYRYKRFKTFQQFTQEMTLLELDNEQENTLTDLVKRYALKEPVSVLFSLRLFDDMATKEISRVLGSAGSAVQKQQYVNMVYEIRKKTYFPELDATDASKNKEKNTEKESSKSLELAPEIN